MFEYCNADEKGIVIKIGTYLSHNLSWVDTYGDILSPSVINGWDRYTLAKAFTDSYINNSYLNDASDKYHIIGGKSKLNTFIRDVAYKIDDLIPKRYFIKYCQLYKIYGNSDRIDVSRYYQGKDNHSMTKYLIYHYKDKDKEDKDIIDIKVIEGGASEKQLKYINALVDKTGYRLKNIDKINSEDAHYLIQFLLGEINKPKWATKYLVGRRNNPITDKINNEKATSNQIKELKTLCEKESYILKNTDALTYTVANNLIEYLKGIRYKPNNSNTYLEVKKEKVSRTTIRYTKKGLKDYIYSYLMNDVKWYVNSILIKSTKVINSWDRLTMATEFIDLRLNDGYSKNKYMDIYKEFDDYAFTKKIALLIDELIPKVYFIKYTELNNISIEYIDKDSNDITKDLIYKGIDDFATQKQLDYLEDLANDSGYVVKNPKDLTCDMASKLINFLKGGHEPDSLFDYLEYE